MYLYLRKTIGLTNRTLMSSDTKQFGIVVAHVTCVRELLRLTLDPHPSYPD
jgi:hypothetical protein